MARKTFYLAREQKHPLYRTRMLQAGPLELDASAARLYQKLGVELSGEAPKSRVQQASETARNEIAPPPSVAVSAQPDDKPPPAAKKAAPKRRRKK